MFRSCAHDCYYHVQIPDIPLCSTNQVFANRADELLDYLKQQGFTIDRKQTVKFNRRQLELCFPEQVHKKNFQAMCDFMTSGPSIAVSLTADKGVMLLKDLCGHEDPVIAREKQPLSIRAKFGTNALKNAVHVSLTPQVRLPPRFGITQVLCSSIFCTVLNHKSLLLVFCRRL